MKTGFVERLINRIENYQINACQWIGVFYGVSLLRNFMEGSVRDVHAIPTPRDNFVHFPLTYLAAYSIAIIFISFLSKERIEKVWKAALFFSAFLLIPPIVDIVIYRGHYFEIGYFHFVGNPITHFVNLIFNPFHTSHAVSHGQRIEVWAMAIGVFVYMRFKRRSTLIALLGPVFVFLLAYLLAVWSYGLCALWSMVETGKWIVDAKGADRVWKEVFESQSIVQDEFRRMALVYALTTFVCASFMLRRYSSKLFNAIIQNIRPARSAHYILLMLFGFLLALRYLSTPVTESFGGNPFDCLGIAALVLAAFLGYQGGVLLNDLYDVEIDKLSNKNRPLVTGSLGKREVQMLACICILASLLFAWCLNTASFSIMVVSHVLSAFYSLPPVRLRRFFVMPHVMIASVCLLAAMFGFSAFSAWLTPRLFPKGVAVMIFAVFFVVVHAKDIKDFAGDEAAGVKTLMTMLGPELGRWVTASLISCAGVFMALFLRSWWLTPICVVLSIACFISTVYSQRAERYLFPLYFCLFACVVFRLL